MMLSAMAGQILMQAGLWDSPLSWIAGILIMLWLFSLDD